MEQKKNQAKYFIISCASILTVILIWFICINVLHLNSEKVFPGPVTVFEPLIDKFHTKAPDGATRI